MSGKDELRAKTVSPGGWGEVASDKMGRYSRPVVREPHGRGRRRCGCGCKGWSTHIGCANGLALMSGCEWMVRRWVRDPDDFWWSLVLRPEMPRCGCGQRVRTESGMRMHVAGSYRHAEWLARSDSAVARRKQP